ncbi:hypothetical protein [Hydrogenimonas sp.]
MKIIVRLVTVISLAFLPFLISGCGGGGGGGGTGASTADTRQTEIGTAYYIDSAVVGVDYLCGSQQGTTDEDGAFRFEKGKGCILSLGTLVLRQIDASQLKDGEAFLETDIKVARLLQSLDNDGHPENGIFIDKSTKAAVSEKIREIPENDEEFNATIEEIALLTKNQNLQPVSEKKAYEHLETSREEYVAVKEPEETENTSIPSIKEYGLQTLDDDAFNALSDEAKIYVAKKLYSTLYKGEDINAIRSEIDSGRFISLFKERLDKDGEQPELGKIIEPDEELFRDDTGGGDAIPRKKGEALEVVISRLLFTHLDKRFYADWMAYELDQTILFSPAWEVDSVRFYARFILSNFDRLRNDIYENKSIRTIVRSHMVSVENWSRFRSPEDNGREMLEIWLQDFDDTHVPIAAVPLQNWKFYSYYERPYQKYVFSQGVGDENNTDTVALFGATLRTGKDFYDMVVSHPDFLPTIVERIVGRFFPTFDAERKQAIAEAILDDEPRTFKDIFDRILFSREYLLESDRVKSVEETMMSLIDTFDFKLEQTGIIRSFISNVGRMNQATMTYKLGREDSVPVDTISMNEYHKFIRNAILINSDESDTYPTDEGINYGQVSERYDRSDLKSFLDGIFMDALGRHISAKEYDVLGGFYRESKIFGDLASASSRSFMVAATLDYISRLSELYQYRKVEMDEQGDE